VFHTCPLRSILAEIREKTQERFSEKTQAPLPVYFYTYSATVLISDNCAFADKPASSKVPKSIVP
ncbi:MAG: hypothetical protein AABY50_06375, partial [Nitrospirota bacterium]